jgi:hypothetical protein
MWVALVAMGQPQGVAQVAQVALMTGLLLLVVQVARVVMERLARRGLMEAALITQVLVVLAAQLVTQ